MDDVSVPNFTNLFVQAYQSGRETARSRGVQNALAMKDPAAAQTELTRFGAFDEANALAKRQALAQAQATRAKAAPMIASGDLAGAQGVYAQGGDFDSAAAISKMSAEHRAEASRISGVIASGLHGLQQLPEDQATRQAGLDKITPFLTSQGVPEADIAKVRNGDLSNATINQLGAATLSFKDQLDRADKEAAQAETVRHNQATENPIKQHVLHAGDTLVETGGQPAADGAQAGPPGARGSASDPRGLRNNNPLNLEASVKWNGMTGNDGRYATFATPQDGWAAADRNLQSYATKHGINTVEGVINRWAPASDNPGGATANYTAAVSRQLGVAPNAPLNMADPTVRRNLAEAMASFENGRPVSWGTGGDVGGPSAQPARQGQGGARVIAKGDAPPDDTGALTPEAIENAALKYNSSGQMPSFGMGKAAVALKQQVMNRAAVLAAADGTTDGGVLRQSIVKGAQQSLSKTMNRHAALRQQAEAANSNASLALSLAAKGGGQTGIPVVNRWLQAGRNSVAGDPDVTAFNNALGGFSEEFAKVMTGSTGSAAATEGARKSAHDRLNTYATQGQLKAGIETMRKEMANVEQSLTDEEARQQEVIRTGGKAPVAAAANPKDPAVKAAVPQDALIAHKAFTQSNDYNAKAPLGSKANPYLARDDATLTALDRLHKGSWAIGPDGSRGQFR